MIARVFPTKTNMSPTDKDAYFDTPDMFTPKYDEVHISCVFTWDIDKARRLKDAWEKKSNRVLLGGPAIPSSGDNDHVGSFASGRYIKKGVTITTRGCPNKCSYCLVNQREPVFKELSIVEGNIIQDNNILACSNEHWRKVLQMLRTQKQIEFKGGLESSRVTPKIAEDLRSLNIHSLWLACDTENSIKPLTKAVGILKKAGFKNSHLYCYTLIGKEELRLRAVRELGCMPFAQLYQKPENKKTEYTTEMKQYQRIMSRPAITRNIF